MTDEKLIERLCGLVSDRTGLRIRSQDTPQLMSAVCARMRHLCLKSPEEYLQLLSGSNDESQYLRRLLAINETYFYRDKGQFELLHARIIPELIDARSADKKLCVWSAGCSTGEEPYSLAILIDQMLPARGDWDIMILGTDMQAGPLEKAREGLYGEWSFRSADKAVISRYFKKKKGLYELSGCVKEMVRLAEHDLIDDRMPDFGPAHAGADLILCRNVFIYYGEKAVTAIVKKLARCLNEGGYLMTGHGELYGIDISPLKPVSFPQSLVYRKPLAHESEKPPVQSVQRPFASAPYKPRQETVPVSVRAGAVADKAADAEAVVREAEVFFKKGEYREAINRLKPALAVGGFAGLVMAARCYANIGDYASAEEYIAKAGKEDPLAMEPYFLMAQLAEARGDAEQAKVLLKKAVYLDPSSVAPHLELASIYEKEGDRGRARKLRLAALDALKSLPSEKQVEGYEGTTAAELCAYVKRMTED